MITIQLLFPVFKEINVETETIYLVLISSVVCLAHFHLGNLSIFHMEFQKCIVLNASEC
jgi:hypothetical protein